MVSGYSTASISERLYFNDGMQGILIYTSNSSSEGTLGGLISNATPESFNNLFQRTINQIKYCSLDPVCYQRFDIDETQNKSYGVPAMYTNAVACRHCLFISENSCDQIPPNTFLDRAIVHSVLNDDQLGFVEYVLANNFS